MTRDDFRDAELYGDTWTPPHGTEKRALRQSARTRLKRWTRALIDKVLGDDDEEERDERRAR